MPAEEIVEQHEAADPEADTSGDFREPHAEEPAEFAAPTEEAPLPAAEEAVVEAPVPASAPPPEPPRAGTPPREFDRDRERRPDRRPEPQRPKPWVKPADFRPAETSAVSQAVELATEIADSLKQMIDHLDEVLELVEVAERQKLADEREIEELRREFRDRYGKLPREVRLLLQCAEIKILAAQTHVDVVETKADKIMLSQRGQLFQVGGKFPRFTKTRPEDKLTELRKLLESLAVAAEGSAG